MGIRIGVRVLQWQNFQVQYGVKELKCRLAAKKQGHIMSLSPPALAKT